MEQKLTDKIGTLKGWVQNENNIQKKIELKSVVVASQVKFNLISLTALMKIGWQLQGDSAKLTLTKGSKQLDLIIRSKDPRKCCLQLKLKGLNQRT